MQIPDWLTWHNVAVFAVSVVGLQLLKWLGTWLNGSVVADFIHKEFQKLREAEENTKLGSFLKQYHADDALWTMAENAAHVVFHEVEEDVQDALKNGDLTKVDWRKYGDKMWAKIRDQAQGGWHDYLDNGAAEDGKEFCAWVAQAVFSKLHLNLQINQTNAATAPAPNPLTTIAAAAAPHLINALVGQPQQVPVPVPVPVTVSTPSAPPAEGSNN